MRSAFMGSAIYHAELLTMTVHTQFCALYCLVHLSARAICAQYTAKCCKRMFTRRINLSAPSCTFVYLYIYIFVYLYICALYTGEHCKRMFTRGINLLLPTKPIWEASCCYSRPQFLLYITPPHLYHPHPYFHPAHIFEFLWKVITLILPLVVKHIFFLSLCHLSCVKVPKSRDHPSPECLGHISTVTSHKKHFPNLQVLCPTSKRKECRCLLTALRCGFRFEKIGLSCRGWRENNPVFAKMWENCDFKAKTFGRSVRHVAVSPFPTLLIDLFLKLLCMELYMGATSRCQRRITCQIIFSKWKLTSDAW